MFSLFKKKQAQSEPPLKKKIKDMKYILEMQDIAIMVQIKMYNQMNY